MKLSNLTMDKYEARRQSLIRLVDSMGRGGRVAVAKAIDKTPDYVSRMLYPFDKKGFKRIGEDTADLITKAFPGWQFESSVEIQTSQVNRIQAAEPSAKYGNPPWPFAAVSESEWSSIPITTRAVIERQIKALVPCPTSSKLAA